MSKKIFVLVPYMGRTDEELMRIREEALAKYQAKRPSDDAELSIPEGKRLCGDMEAMLASDIVIGVRYHAADAVCNLVEQAAYVYGKWVVDDREIENWLDESDITGLEEE